MLALSVLCALLVGVEAGSRAWESTVKYQRTAELEAIQARDLSAQITSNGTTHQLRRSAAHPSPGHNNNTHQRHDKRWFGIKPDGVTLNLWPQGNIKVCFEDKTYGAKGSTEDILKVPLDNARGLWRDRGLDDRDGWFAFEFVTDAAWCADRNNRPDFLLVMYAGIGVNNMATTPGMGPRVSTTSTVIPADEAGPRMTLSDNADMGHKNVVANYAHEMGHSWGLHHEHQNPLWWDEDYSGAVRTKYFFGTDSFFCTRLADYPAAVARVNADNIPDYEKTGYIRQLCKKRTVADSYKFAGGLNWLPVLDGVDYDNSKKQPDYDSIMIYPSTAGNGGLADSTDTAIMLQKPDGETIKPVSKPSLLDVEGLKKMYNKPKPSLGKLLSSKTSQYFSKFKKVRAQDSDAGCI